MQLKLLNNITDNLLFSDLTLKADDHYGNVIRVEKFQSDMAIKAFGSGHSKPKWFRKDIIRIINAEYSLVLLAL